MKSNTERRYHEFKKKEKRKSREFLLHDSRGHTGLHDDVHSVRDERILLSDGVERYFKSTGFCGAEEFQGYFFRQQ